MARKLRVQYPSRGDRREPIYQSERLVQEELLALGWSEKDLSARRKGDNGKIRIAKGLRQETTMSPKWIAKRLHMGSWTYVSNLLNSKSLTTSAAGTPAVVSIVRTDTCMTLAR